MVVTKRTSRREYIIQKKLHTAFPKYIPKPLGYSQATGIMRSQKCGVSLKKWLKTHKYTRSTISKFIQDVRLILEKIRRKFPGFRHMDLHIQNVLVCRGRCMIIDFGLSKFSVPATKPVGYDMCIFRRSLRKFLATRRRPRELRPRASSSPRELRPRELRSSCPCPRQQPCPPPGSAASIAKKLLRV